MNPVRDINEGVFIPGGGEGTTPVSRACSEGRRE